jgi:hypothetical protein
LPLPTCSVETVTLFLSSRSFPAVETLPPRVGAMNEIRVECYAGYRADERPLRFGLSGRSFEVTELDARWYSPGASYFRVLAADGNFYVLRHDVTQGTWTLDSVRAKP